MSDLVKTVCGDPEYHYIDMGSSPNWAFLGVLRSSFNKDHGILGSIFGAPYLWRPPYRPLRRRVFNTMAHVGAILGGDGNLFKSTTSSAP